MKKWRTLPVVAGPWHRTAMTPVPRLFDQDLQKERIARAFRLGAETFLLDRVLEDLGDRLAPVQRRFSRVLDFLPPGSAAESALAGLQPGATIERFAGADIERPELGTERHDLIVSLLCLHHVNDLPGVLMQIRRALVPDGLFMAAVPGGDTLQELRTVLMEAEEAVTGGASPRVSPFADVRSLGQLLQRAGFALPVADSERIVVRYSEPLTLLTDLRRMGATNVLTARARTPLRRDVLFRALELYRDRFADADGKVRATFEIVWLSGWAPHHSQQQPLKPGSARMKLEDALKAHRPGEGK